MYGILHIENQIFSVFFIFQEIKFLCIRYMKINFKKISLCFVISSTKESLESLYIICSCPQGMRM